MLRVMARPRVVAISNVKTADRKSTRLNSSHGYISYAVFCLKKKTKTVSRHAQYTDDVANRHSARIVLRCVGLVSDLIVITDEQTPHDSIVMTAAHTAHIFHY